MAGKVLSMEIGNFLTKICEMEQKAKNPKIYHSFTLETPQGMLDDGTIAIREGFVDQIKKRLAEKNIHTKQIIFTIASTKIASREITIPFVKESRISSLIQANASSYFPVDITKYKFAHSILSTEEDDKGIKQHKLLILAAPDQMLESYHSFAEALGMEVVAIDYIGNSIYQAVKADCEVGTHMVMKVDEFSTLLIIIKDATIALTRTIPYGISEGIQAMIQSGVWGESPTFSQALEFARTQNVLNTIDSSLTKTEVEENLQQPNLEKAKKDVVYSLSTLAGGILRVADYYNSANTGNLIEFFKLTGIGSDFLGLADLLSKEMNCKIETVSQLKGMDLEQAFQDANFGEYISCIGAIIDPMEFYSHTSVDAKKKKKLMVGNDLTLPISVLILCVAVSAALALIALIPYQNAKSQNRELTLRRDELLPVKEIYQSYLDVTADYEKNTNWELQSKGPLDEIIIFIEELEDKMPGTFAVQSLTADNSKVSLEVKVGSKEEATKVIEQLRTFELVNSVSVASITEVVSDAGETQVVFSVDIDFLVEEVPTAAPVPATTETTTTQTPAETQTPAVTDEPVE